MFTSLLASLSQDASFSHRLSSIDRGLFICQRPGISALMNRLSQSHLILLTSPGREPIRESVASCVGDGAAMPYSLRGVAYYSLLRGGFRATFSSLFFSLLSLSSSDFKRHVEERGEVKALE